jgi:hypothetical protein
MDVLVYGVIQLLQDVASVVWMSFYSLGLLGFHTVGDVLSSVDFTVDNPFTDVVWHIEYDLFDNIFTGSFSTVAQWITDVLGVHYMPVYEALLYVTVLFFFAKVLISWLSFLRS